MTFKLGFWWEKWKSTASLTYLVEIPQINGEVACGQRRAYEPVPSASWANFDVKLIRAPDCVGHVARVAGVEDGGGMRLKIDHDVSGFLGRRKGVGCVDGGLRMSNLLDVVEMNTRQATVSSYTYWRSWAYSCASKLSATTRGATQVDAGLMATKHSSNAVLAPFLDREVRGEPCTTAIFGTSRRPRSMALIILSVKV